MARARRLGGHFDLERTRGGWIMLLLFSRVTKPRDDEFWGDSGLLS